MLLRALVKRISMDEEGRPILVVSKNPLLNHRQYEVEYIKRRIEFLTSNIVAENLLTQVDNDGH